LKDSGRIGYNEFYTFLKIKDSTDIVTKIPKTTSVYLRMRFNVATKNNIHTLCLYNDYNDGFVAYLNGHEIARANLGKPGDFIPYNRVTDRTHKAYNYRNYFKPISGYYIDSSLVNKYLLNGSNILSVQVHNDSINGFDLSFNCSLADITGHQYALYQDYYLRQIAVDSSLFPIVVINTNGYGVPYEDSTFKAKMGIIYNNERKYNRLKDTFNNYNGYISIKIHGQSSADFPKKSFSVETEDSLGNNNNVPIMGMPAENDWILSAQFTDKSIIRNEFTFYLGRRQGHYETRTRYCEFILDGEFLGLYIMTEKIKRDSNRVNIAKLKTTDITGTDVTGGYIMKYDKPNNAVLQVTYPKEEDIQPQQTNYINQYLTSYYNALNSAKFLDPDLGYKRYMDPKSLIDYIIVEDAVKNPDGYYFSTYMYKDKITRDGRLKFGPLWDNDIVMGNGYFQDGCQTNGWQFAEPTNNDFRITKIMRDTSFVHQFQASWAKARATYLNTDSALAVIDSLVNYIKTERIRNYEVWPIIDGSLFYPCYSVSNYDQEISTTKTWLTNRLLWIDNNISKLYYPIADISSFTISNNDFDLYPNPFSNNINIKFQLRNPGNYYFELNDTYGRKISSSSHITYNQGENSYLFNDASIANLPKGLYILSVIESGNIVHQSKLIKQ
jgi:hypothetical protein